MSPGAFPDDPVRPVETPPIDSPPPSAAGKGQITLSRFPDGLTIEVPPAGIWRGSRGLIFFAVVWLVITIPISFALFGALLAARQQAKADGLGLFLSCFVMMPAFWAVGIGLLLAAINMGVRRAVLAITSGRLMVLQTGLFGSRERSWPLEEVEVIRAGPSGMTVNDRPVLELQIDDGGETKFGLLAGRSDDELHWLAAELSASLRAQRSLAGLAAKESTTSDA